MNGWGFLGLGRPQWMPALALAVSVALAGCSQSAESADAEAGPAPAAGQPASPANAADAAVGGDGSEITLNTLTQEDVEGAGLAGELACSFSAGDGQPILLARGNVDSDEPAQGVVKVGRYVERVAAPGGFDAMLEGASFSGKGKTVKIDVTGEAIGEGESPPRPATLTYMRADGASRGFDGFWQCGP